jgi:hypothetical protein
MKLLEITKRENFDRMSYDFHIRLFGLLVLHKEITQMQVVIGKLPSWFKVLRFFVDKKPRQ